MLIILRVFLFSGFAVPEHGTLRSDYIHGHSINHAAQSIACIMKNVTFVESTG